MGVQIRHPDTRSPQTVIILPETGGSVLCVRFTGLIRKEDHKHNLYDPLNVLIAQYGYYSMVIDYHSGFIGWEPDAADFSLRSIMELGQQARRLAYINPPEKKVLQNKLAAPLFGGEARFFEAGEYDAAIGWVRED